MPGSDVQHGAGAGAEPWTADAAAVDDVHGLARQLVEATGHDATDSTVSTAPGTNANAIVTITSGDRFVYRRYQWPGDGASAPSARMRREAWLFERLGSPKLLAQADEPPALLLEFIEGATLGELAASGDASDEQWAETGAAFRALHDLSVDDAIDAGLVLERFDAARDLADLARRLESLEKCRPDLDVAAAWDAHRLAASAGRRTSIIHGDAHLWNVWVGARSTLIDLEKSAIGDPDFDLAYFEGLRFAEGIGPVPDSFYEGYGRRPSGPWYDLHRVAIAATVVEVVANGYAALSWDLPRAEGVLRG